MLACPCCTGKARPTFKATVLGKHRATYATCDVCCSLFIVSPFWLNEAYANPASSDELDTGAHWRNATVYSCLRTLKDVVPTGTWLDYGSGRGLLQKCAAPQPIKNYDPKRNVGSISTELFPVITCLEVLEHVVQPQQLLEQLKALLHPDGVIVLSTCLREPHYGSAWPYLATASGQHITFPSRCGFHFLCEKAQITWLCSLISVEHQDLQVHLLSNNPKALPKFDLFTQVPPWSSDN